MTEPKGPLGQLSHYVLRVSEKERGREIIWGINGLELRKSEEREDTQIQEAQKTKPRINAKGSYNQMARSQRWYTNKQTTRKRN